MNLNYFQFFWGHAFIRMGAQFNLCDRISQWTNEFFNFLYHLFAPMDAY